jgi:hypothetical protein
LPEEGFSLVRAEVDGEALDYEDAHRGQEQQSE